VAPRSPLTKRPSDREGGPHSSGVQAVASRASFDLREVFDEYAPFIWRAVRHLGVPESDVEDVCQEVWVAVHRKLGGFEGRSTLRTWLYGICLRITWDHRRRAHVQRELPVAEPPERAVEPTQHEELMRGEGRRQLDTLLQKLDEDKRAVFVLYELEELTMKEVAEIIGCPLQTAYSRLHAARRIVVEASRELAEVPG
jgi:RNA polymerase sigma-70 factor (ECF subfamily)